MTVMISLIAVVISANPIRSSVDLYQAEVAAGTPLLVRVARENLTSTDLQSATGDGDPEWLQVSLLRAGNASPISLVCTRRHTKLVRNEDEEGMMIAFGTALDAQRTNVSYAGFMLPKSLPPGEYTVQCRWSYAYGPAQWGGVAAYDQVESGSATMRATVSAGSASALTSSADDLASRVLDEEWEGRRANGFGLAAADALFSMDSGSAGNAWRRLASASQKSVVNDVSHSYCLHFNTFATLAQREEPKAIEVLLLLAATEKSISPSSYESQRPYFLKAFGRLSKSETLAVASAAQKAYDEIRNERP